MMTLEDVILTLTITVTALIAGLFYAYACSVNPGLAKLSDQNYLSAMQSINRAILNPVFFASFMGTLVMLPIATWLEYRSGMSVSAHLLLAAVFVYAVGVFGVTVVANVPLNQALDKFDPHTASAAELASRRANFELPWNRWNTVRTVAAVIALVLAVVACICRSVTAIPGK